MDQAAKILDAAKASGQAEGALRAIGQSANAGIAEKLAAKGEQEAVVKENPVEKQMAEAGDKRMQRAINEGSPEAKALLAQQAPAAAPAAPALAVVAGAAPAGQTKTVITCQGTAYFDSKMAMGVFVDDVVVIHPQFIIHCEELEVYMAKDKPKPAAAVNVNGKPIPGGAPSAETPASAIQDGGIDRAIAKGKRVIIEKLDEHGEPQIGICRHCTYIGSNGDVFLRDMPQVQRGSNVIRATSPTTYMVITQDGKLNTHGPTATDIIQKKKADDPAAATPPASGAAPAPKAPTARKSKTGP